jgi:hypothetical protein
MKQNILGIWLVPAEYHIISIRNGQTIAWPDKPLHGGSFRAAGAAGFIVTRSFVSRETRGFCGTLVSRETKNRLTCEDQSVRLWKKAVFRVAQAFFSPKGK